MHAVDLAGQLLAWLTQRCPHGVCTEPVDGDAAAAAFEHSSSVQYAAPRSYRVSKLPDEYWLLTNSPQTQWFHDLLVTLARAT
jgi:hypothetical protein